jgi:mannosyltransferase
MEHTYPRTTPTSDRPLLAGSLLVRDAAQYMALAAITLLALALRWYKLGEWSFWIDEALTVNYVLAGSQLFSSPTSFQLIGAAFHFLGVSDFSARLGPMLLGVAAMPALYLPVRRLFGPGVALLALLLLALSPWHLYWSQNARFYTALLLLYSLGMLAFYQWLETNRIAWLGLAGVLLFFAALERMTAVLFAPAAGLYLVILLLVPGFGRPAALTRRNLLLLAAPVALIAGYVLFFTSVPAELAHWILGRSHNPLRVLLSVVYDLGLPLFLLALLGGVFLVQQRSRAGLYFLLGAVVPLAALVAISPFTQTFSRYVYMTLPIWAVLAAAAAREIFVHVQRPGRVLALGLVLVLLADAASQNVLYFTTQNGNRENYKAAYAQVQAGMQPGDWVVTTRSEIADYYLGLTSVDSNRIDLDGILASGRPAWFVMDNRTHVSEELQRWIPAHTQLVGVYDVHIPGRPMEMRVHYYGVGENGQRFSKDR